MAAGGEIGWFTGVLLATAFLPPILYAAWVRGLEQHAQEPWGSLFQAFGWGATGGVLIAVVLEVVLGARPDAVAPYGISALVLTAVIIAPVVEEAAKAVGLRWVEDLHLEPEDGLIYGAAAGFGFAATENLVYGLAALWEGGVGDLIMTAAIRSISAAFLHGAATALVGWGIWRYRLREATAGTVVGLYLVAVALHAAYNLGASLNLGLAFLGSLVLALGTFRWVRKRVISLDDETRPVFTWER